MQLEDNDFKRLWMYMKERYGVNLEKKRTLVEGRLSNPMTKDGFHNYHDYIDNLLSDPTGEKVLKLVSLLTTNYTYFMREDAHYRFMTNTALPEWTSKIKNYDLRTWSAGCSSGEEAYTTAMVINEYFGGNRGRWDTTILATDISQKVLEEARAGVYPEDHFKSLPRDWLAKYFTQVEPGKYKISPTIAKQVNFGTLNLMGEFTFRKQFHIIFCRNVMIYFDMKTKAALARKFYDVLEPGGYFFIGMSETLSGIDDHFTQISPAIYRKGRE